MPEIGETLREARMRRRIDMTEVEAATKIRAKYLRALENEEWDLLPGPTFVKTFLRTYAEYLELDPRMLVEEYRQRFERPSTQDLTPFGPGMGSLAPAPPAPAAVARAVRRRPVRRLVAAAARCTGSASWGDDRRSAAPLGRRRRRPRRATATPAKTAKPKAKKKARARARLAAAHRQVVARVRLPGRRHGQGRRQRRVPRAGQEHQDASARSASGSNFGNSEVTLRVGSKRYAAANTGKPIGYEVRPGKKPTRLSEAARVGALRP